MSEELEQLIERVARAIYANTYGSSKRWEDDPDVQHWYYDEAREVLEAAFEAAGIPTLIRERDALREALREIAEYGDGYGWEICVEDRQHWPCATIVAMQNAARGEV